MADIRFEIPPQVLEIINDLRDHTYSAYIVGDCIRAYIQRERPLDFDIITNAEPERIIAIFEEKYKTKPGLLPGELIIINGAMGISVSPFRTVDALGRHVYGGSDITLDDDLRQRVYTADAIAYDVDKGVYDPFDGISCISDHTVVLRAIGEKDMAPGEETPPKKAKKGEKKNEAVCPLPVMSENPVTALRAIRRFSKGGISISAPTKAVLTAYRRELLDALPDEELLDAAKDILLGKRITDVLQSFRPFLFTLIPKLAETDGMEQRSMFQEYTLYEHITRAVGYSVPDFTVRLALLLHGIGKKDCEANRSTYNSYDGHEERGAMLARELMKDYLMPENIISEVVFLILHHDDPIDETNYTRYTAEYGIPLVKKLLLMQAADLRAKSSDKEHEQRASELRALSDSIGVSSGKAKTGRTITSADLRKLFGNK